MSSVNISSQNVQVNPTTTENKIDIVTTTENNVTVTQPSIQTVEVLTGPQGPAGSSGSIYSNSTTVTYTSANILALDEIDVLPAPSSGQYYEFKLILEYNFVTTPYSGVGILQIPTAPTAAGSLLSIPTVSENKINGYFEGVNDLNSPLTFRIRPGGTITGGDGTLTLKVQYNIATFG